MFNTWITKTSILALSATAALGCAGETELEGTSSSALDTALVAPGRGYDMIRDQATDFCTDFEVRDAFPNGAGQETVFRLELVENSKNMAKKLSVSASASAKFGLWGGDLKTSYVEEREVHSTSVYALASASVRNAPQVIINTRLKPDAANTLRVSAENFRRRCGDAFVAGYTTGGEFFGVIEIETQTEQEKQEVTANLNAGGLMWNASAQFALAVNSSVANKRVHVWSFQRGGRGEQSTGCTTVDCIVSRAANLPSTVAGDNAAMIKVDFMNYDRLALPNDARSPIDTLNQQEVEGDIVAAKHDQRDLLGQFLAAQRFPTRYYAVSPADMTASINAINGNINTLRHSASDCWRDYASCAVPAIAPAPIQVPKALPSDTCAKVRALCTDGQLDETIADLQEACFEKSGRYVNLRTCL